MNTLTEKQRQRFRSVKRGSPNTGEKNHLQQQMAAAVTHEDKLRVAAQRRIKIASRVSSHLQAEHEGSFLAQEKRTLRRLENMGIPTASVENVRVVESGGSGKNRVTFEEMLSQILQGLVGVLIVGYGDRLARNLGDGLRLVEAASEQLVIIMIAERILDPRIPHDRDEILRQIAAAELENSIRALHSAEGREELAKKLKFRRRLPTGLVYAIPSDPAYQTMAKEADLEEWISEDQLSKHATNFEMHGVPMYILPDPHPGVFKALQLITEWLLDTGDPTEVRRRIREHPSYPRPGLVPMATNYTFKAGVPPKWQEPRRGWLRGWFASEALYGVYSYKSVGLTKYGRDDAPHLLLPHAFPSLLSLDQLEDVDDIFRNPDRRWKRGGYTGPRNNLLKRVFCAHRNEDGTVCGGKAGPVFDADGDGSFLYFGGTCVIEEGHHARFPRHIDLVVEQILREAFTPAKLEGVESVLLEDVQRIEDAVATLERSVANLSGEIESGLELQSQAKSAGNLRRVAEWNTKLDTWETQRADLEERLRQERANSITLLDISVEDVERTLELAGDIPRLFDLANELETIEWGEGLRRALVRLLVDRVRAKTLGCGLYEVVVRFPSGFEVKGYLSTARLTPNPGERAYIAARLGGGEHPAEIADALTRARRAFTRLPFGKKQGEWKLEDVVAVDLAMPDQRQCGRTGMVRISEIVVRSLEDELKVRGAALSGALGPIKMVDGEITVSPTPKEIERAFPDTAVQRVAQATGWPIEEVHRRADVKKLLGRNRTLSHLASHEVYRCARGRVFVRIPPAAWEKLPLQSSGAEGGDSQ